MVPDAQKLCCLHLAVHRRLAGLPGVAVLVVKGAGTAVFNQIRKGCKGGVVNHIGINILEYAVNLVNPVHHHHVGIVNGYEIAHKGLEEMMVGVNQAGIHELSLCLYYLDLLLLPFSS